MRRPVPSVGASLAHPGPRAEERIVSSGGAPVSLLARGKAGESLVSVLGRAAEQTGVSGGIFCTRGLPLAAFTYVTPAPPMLEDDRHVAWYSDPLAHPAATLSDGSATLGLRDGAWWLHVHAQWPGALSAAPGAGHLLPETLILADDCEISGRGVAGAGFEVRMDPETEFPLFRVSGEGTGTAALATLAPGMDLTEAIETLAARHCPGVPSRAVGLCSFAGARHADAPGEQRAWISESFLTGATVDQHGRAQVSAAGIDILRTESGGRLIRGAAPILVTAELLIFPQ